MGPLINNLAKTRQLHIPEFSEISRCISHNRALDKSRDIVPGFVRWPVMISVVPAALIQIQPPDKGGFRIYNRAFLVIGGWPQARRRARLPPCRQVIFPEQPAPKTRADIKNASNMIGFAKETADKAANTLAQRQPQHLPPKPTDLSDMLDNHDLQPALFCIGQFSP